MTAEGLLEAMRLLGWSEHDLAIQLEIGDRIVGYWVSGNFPVPKTVEYAVKYLVDNRNPNMIDFP